MIHYTVELSEAEEKAISLRMVMPIQEWLDNAIHNKARQCIDTVVELESDKQANKLNDKDKAKIVKDSIAGTAKAKQDREMAERMGDG